MLKKLSIVSIAILFLFGNLLATQSGAVQSSDGVSIHYSSYGKAAKTLLFIHCWCGDSTFWEKQVDQFSKTYRVVVLDLAGHGKSGMERKEYTIPAFAEDVATVIKKLDLKEVILIGHSMGGPVMIATAALFPKRVKALVAVDTLHMVEFKWPEASFKARIAAMESDFKKATTAFIGSMIPPGTDKSVREKIIATTSGTNAKVGIGAMKGLYRFKLIEAMAKIKKPIYCVNGSMWPTNTAMGAKHALSFKAKIIAGGGHFPHMEKPAEFNKAFAEILKELQF